MTYPGDEQIAKRGRMSIGLIEYGVQSFPAPEFVGWRFFRIEYGGHAEHCLKEVHIWFPPGFDVNRFEDEMDAAGQGKSLDAVAAQLDAEQPQEGECPICGNAEPHGCRECAE